MLQSVWYFIKELFTPSNLETETPANRAYGRAKTYAYHYLFGAAANLALLWFGVPALMAFGIIGALYVLKEAVDLYSGGKFRDSLEDTASTMAGAFFATNPYFAVIGVGLSVVVVICSLVISK